MAGAGHGLGALAAGSFSEHPRLFLDDPGEVGSGALPCGLTICEGHRSGSQTH
jgi:hypothetical protein